MKTKRPTAQKKTKAEALYRLKFAERLKQATENHEIGGLAAKIGVTPATLYRWLTARYEPSLAKLAQLADAMNVNLAWLVTGKGPFDSRRALRHSLLEEYEITEFESVGGKAEKPPLAFHEPWLFELLYGPSNEPTLFGAGDLKCPLLIEVLDDSMMPTIAMGELLIIDKSFGVPPAKVELARNEERSPHDGIYAFRSRSVPDSAKSSGGLVVVRRLQHRLDGTVVIRCDNPSYPEEVYGPDVPNRPEPIGPVVWRGGRV
jgi:transcriptional regulator with XRE-family HTH domain